jgi:hypothetical protein
VLDIQITNASLKDIQGGRAASLDEGTGNLDRLSGGGDQAP